MKKKKSRVIWIIVILAAAVTVSVPILGSKTPVYTSEIVQSRTIENWYTFAGTVQSQNSETLTARKSVEIKEVLINEKDKVEQGEVLFITTDDEEVKASFEGTIQTLYVKKGDIAAAGAPLCEMIDFESLEVVLYISEYDLDRVQEGDLIDIHIAAAHLEAEAKIEELSNTASQQGGSMYFTAVAGIDSNSALRIGMTAEAKVLKAAAYEEPAISLNMLQYDMYGAPFVEILNDKNGFERREIQIGISDGVYVTVISGLEAGEEIVRPEAQSSGGLADSLIPGIPG